MKARGIRADDKETMVYGQAIERFGKIYIFDEVISPDYLEIDIDETDEDEVKNAQVISCCLDEDRYFSQITVQAIKIIPETLGYATGDYVKDDEIYQGDILQDKEKTENIIISELTIAEWLRDLIAEYNYTIIGNIHQNKELLEEK